METGFDVAVIGGGPCGSFAALHSAKRGAKVAVFEEHAEIGVPSHCAGHLSIKGLRRLGLFPLPEGIVEGLFHGAVFHSPLGKEFTVRFSSPVTCSVNRVLFDRHITKLAEKAGARYFLNSRVESLAIENGFVKGLYVNEKNPTRKVRSNVVVDAEGVSSRLLRQVGLPMLDRRHVVNGVEVEVENAANLESGTVEVFLGKTYAPGLYAWLIPKSDEKAKIGLAANAGNPLELLRRFMHEQPVAKRKLDRARILRSAFHPITLGGQIPRICSNGFLAVGDVASQVKPTTGGGVILGLTCATLAAETAERSLHKQDFSSRALDEYQKRCKECVGFDLKAMLWLRKTLDRMSDEQLDKAIGVCSEFGLDGVFQRMDDIDLQGRAFLHAFRQPQVLFAFLYLGYLWLSANA